VDASVALGWYLADESDRAYALEVLAGVESNQIVVPPLWIYELMNGLISACRRKRLAQEAILEALGEVRRLSATIETVDGGEPTRIAELAMAHGLTAYDAAYLE
jgi:predicted nucleic acid-binding protein